MRSLLVRLSMLATSLFSLLARIGAQEGQTLIACPRSKVAGWHCTITPILSCFATRRPFKSHALWVLCKAIKLDKRSALLLTRRIACRYNHHQQRSGSWCQQMHLYLIFRSISNSVSTLFSPCTKGPCRTGVDTEDRMVVVERPSRSSLVTLRARSREACIGPRSFGSLARLEPTRTERNHNPAVRFC